MTLLEPVAIPSLKEFGQVHFIAIGGAGMSGIAAAYLRAGLVVTGSDQADSAALRALDQAGAQVWVGHDPSHVRGADAVVVSTAIRQDNPELVEARREGLPILHRSVALAALTVGQTVVSVAGTHGKTTTTAMCVCGLRGAGGDPSFVVGGVVLGLDTGSHLGADHQFIIEADESDGTFLQYPTTVAVVTGIDADHLDNWGTTQAYARGFERFTTGQTVTQVILNADDPGAASLGQFLREQGRTVMTYGRGHQCDVRLVDIELSGEGGVCDLVSEDWTVRLMVGVPGVHNLYNAAAAVCVGEVLGADRSGVLAGIAGFRGTARRFEPRGTVAGVTVVDDYAHHPTEVAATIAAAREVVGSGRLIVCFQPHLFSRTRMFSAQFGQVLAQADLVVVLDVYPAREAPIPGVTGQLVVDAVREAGGDVVYAPGLDEAAAVVARAVRPSDLVLTVGAGSITTLGPMILDLVGRS
ncbi:MAG: UDP-N-acetylmuramate--L-alanine ligase [Propionibacteriaceae bacterium]|jgi:UDP-N-acetylmuramate--alanine ligase|nr:UDP-N-acetylmuramate--L-alanine ligase [Propionibacteriaceae bacterium]